MSAHQQIYEQARCYDVAFGFRDVPAECDTLAGLVQQHAPARAPARRVLELAAGPARHAREFARRGAQALALDRSPAMGRHAEQQARQQGLALATACADMVDFQLPQRFDLALLLMDSASYLLDNDAVLRHLRAVAAHLDEDGLYVLEMSHPRSSFGLGTTTRSDWTAEADGLRVRTRWGAEGDAFDPVTQIDEVTVTMDWHSATGQGRLVERARQRRFTANEVDALVRASGCFDTVQRLGALAPPVPFDNAPAAWRMVLVLRRRAPAA